MKEYFEDKVAVVTGGASGIGLSLCEEMLSLGARGVVAADLNEDKLKTECIRLEATYPGKVLGVCTDIANQESVFDLIKKSEKFGAGLVDFLFNNAGRGLPKPFDATTDAEWKYAFEINFYGPLNGVRAVLPIKRAQGGGHIINVSSGVAFSPMAFQTMYSAAKAALMVFTSSLRSELWDEGIRLSTVIPGIVATPMWDKAGGAPDFTITAQEAALGILKGVAANERIIILMEYDLNSAKYGFLPEYGEQMDAHVLNVTRQRRSGNFKAF